jgi:hypothetical protein
VICPSGGFVDSVQQIAFCAQDRSTKIFSPDVDAGQKIAIKVVRIHHNPTLGPS